MHVLSAIERLLGAVVCQIWSYMTGDSRSQHRSGRQAELGGHQHEGPGVRAHWITAGILKVIADALMTARTIRGSSRAYDGCDVV